VISKYDVRSKNRLLDSVPLEWGAERKELSDFLSADRQEEEIAVWFCDRRLSVSVVWNSRDMRNIANAICLGLRAFGYLRTGFPAPAQAPR
jgi:hypothetical protein